MNHHRVILITLILFYSNISISNNIDNLSLPNWFKVTLFAKNIEAPRQMVEGEDYIFVGGIKGKIFALRKSMDYKKPASIKIIASGLNNSRGVALKNGDLYFSEVDKIWIIKNIEKT